MVHDVHGKCWTHYDMHTVYLRRTAFSQNPEDEVECAVSTVLVCRTCCIMDTYSAVKGGGRAEPLSPRTRCIAKNSTSTRKCFSRPCSAEELQNHLRECWKHQHLLKVRVCALGSSVKFHGAWENIHRKTTVLELTLQDLPEYEYEEKL